MKPPLRLTRHALDEIVVRNLERSWVERVASNPSGRNRLAGDLTWRCVSAGLDAGGKVLRVTTADEGGVRVVLTAHFDRAARRPTGASPCA